MANVMSVAVAFLPLAIGYLPSAPQPRPQAVSGLVQDTQCHPLPGVVVSGTSPAANSVVTDSKGRFTLAVKPDAVEVQMEARLAGFRRAARTATFIGSAGDQLITLDAAELAEVQRASGVDRVKPDPRLRGIVLTSLCAPIPDAEVQVGDGKGATLTKKTGPDGRFVFDPIAAGSYLVTVHAPSYMPLFRYETKISAADTMPVRLVLDHAGNGASDAWLAR